MKAKNITLVGEAAATGETSLDKAIFGLELRSDILHRVVNWQLARRQAGTHAVLSRSEVAGSTRKLFRQKGTGNARTSDAKGPHKRGGGVIFGPVVRSHAHSLPKKIRALGLKVALSSKQKDGKVFVLGDEKFENVKTAQVAKALQALGIKSALIITGETFNDNFARAVRNIKEIDLLPVQGANVYDILRRENLVLTKDAVKKLEERFNG